jgi:DNA-binding response OmpR family regulator
VAGQNLAKPFHFTELVLRIRAPARRQPAARARTLRDHQPAAPQARRPARHHDHPGTGYHIAGPGP